jgi:hypothetical protein
MNRCSSVEKFVYFSQRGIRGPATNSSSVQPNCLSALLINAGFRKASAKPCAILSEFPMGRHCDLFGLSNGAFEGEAAARSPGRGVDCLAQRLS